MSVAREFGETVVPIGEPEVENCLQAEIWEKRKRKCEVLSPSMKKKIKKCFSSGTNSLGIGAIDKEMANYLVELNKERKKHH